MSDSLNQFVHDWTILVNRVTELETRVLTLEDNLRLATQQTPAEPQPVNTYVQPVAPGTPGAVIQAPPGWPAGGLGTSPPGMQSPGPQFPPAPQAPAMPPQATPGPQAVPTFEQLLERGMQVSEAKGDQTCIDLIAKYGGKDEQGTIKISLVPQDKYAALFADFSAQLGLH